MEEHHNYSTRVLICEALFTLKFCSLLACSRADVDKRHKMWYPSLRGEMKYEIDGEKLRYLRQEVQGWTQDELGDRAHVDRSLISKIENNRKENVYMHVALSIAHTLGVPVEEIIVGSFPKSEPSLLVMMNHIEGMTPEEKKSVLDYIQFVLSKRGEST